MHIRDLRKQKKKLLTLGYHEAMKIWIIPHCVRKQVPSVATILQQKIIGQCGIRHMGRTWIDDIKNQTNIKITQHLFHLVGDKKDCHTDFQCPGHQIQHMEKKKCLRNFPLIQNECLLAWMQCWPKKFC